MCTIELTDAIADVLTDRRLLGHPFYRRWEAGQVSIAELGLYAAQYRHFESYLPRFLARLVAGLPEGTARDLVAANLADEEGDPIAHVDLFERFAAAVGAGHEPPSPAMSALLATYEDLIDACPVKALAGFVGYELQASEVAQRKAEGLRIHFGLDEPAVSFWAHHASVDAEHGEWALRALDELIDSLERPLPSIRRAADTWWLFLDEREELSHSS